MVKNICVTSFRQIWKKARNFGKYDIVMPRQISRSRTVPKTIVTPNYYEDGAPLSAPIIPEIKNQTQIDHMRTSCKLASILLYETGKQLQVGRTTDDIDKFVHEFCINNNAYPSPLRYRGFPKSVCTSVNNVACHGIPDDRPLINGDIINVDVTVFFNGFHGDCSRTFLIGNVDSYGIDLVETTEKLLQEAIEICKPGVKFCAIGNHIEYRAKELGYNVVPSLVGHGIGSYFHGPPDIYHCGNNYPGVMKTGMTFTIEPALTQGCEEIVVMDDGWTALTADNARSAQCEHTILITKDGVEVLTLPPGI